jgi:hypothetical protein
MAQFVGQRVFAPLDTETLILAGYGPCTKRIRTAPNQGAAGVDWLEV